MRKILIEFVGPPLRTFYVCTLCTYNIL